MPLRKQPLALQFSGGLHSKMDAKQVPTTKLLDLQNAVFERATTLVKRNGYEALSSTIDAGAVGLVDSLNLNTTATRTLSNPIGLGVHQGEVVAFDGKRGYSRRPSSETWSDAGEVCAAVGSDRQVARTGTQQTMGEHATQNGVTAIAWEDSRGGVWYSLIESETRRILVADTQLDAAGISPRCLPCGDFLHIIWANAAGRKLWVIVIDPTFPTTPLATNVLVDNLDPLNPVYDACVTVNDAAFAGLWGNTTSFPCLIAWAVDSGGFNVGYIHQSGILGSALTELPAVRHEAVTLAPGTIGCCFEPRHLASVAVLYNASGNSLAMITIDPGLTTEFAVGTVLSTSSNAFTRIACCYANANQFTPNVGGDDGCIWWAAETLPAASATRSDRAIINNGFVGDEGTILIASRTLRGHSLCSRAFFDNDHVYVAIVHAVLYFPYVAIVRISGDVWGSRTITAARLLPNLTNGQLPRNHLPSVHAISPDVQIASLSTVRQYELCLGYRVQLASDATTSTNFGEQGIRLQALDFGNENAYQTAPLGAGLYLAGALMQHYDGARWAEAGFATAPDHPSGPAGVDQTLGFVVLDGGSGGGSIAAGTYNYIAVYEEIDNQGERHQGPASVPVSVTIAGASSTAQVTVPTCKLTSKKNVRITLWRSKQGSASEYFRITSTDPSKTTGANCFLANDPTVDDLAFVDALSDAVLGNQEPLYTNGGILSNIPAPCAGGIIAGGKYRLFWTDPSDPDLVRFSQTLDEFDDAMAESAALAFRVDPYGGAIVALAVLDDAVVIFKETAMYVVGGSGPDADGGASNPNNAFTPPALVTSDVGCSSPKGIVQMPMGIMFPTTKGIMLLGRDRQSVASVGDDVYGFKGQIISRATLLPDRHQIVFLTASGSTLLFDYEHQQWSRFTNHEGFDAVVADGVYHYLRTDGRVFRETPGKYADDNLHIPMLISTAWIKMAGYLQGWQKVIHAGVLGEYESAHTLRMRYRIDYEERWSNPDDHDMSLDYAPSLYGVGLYGVGAYSAGTPLDTVYQRSWHINRRCQAIAFEFSDREADGVFGASFQLSELLLTGGVLGPRIPIGAARSA